MNRQSVRNAVVAGAVVTVLMVVILHKQNVIVVSLPRTSKFSDPITSYFTSATEGTYKVSASSSASPTNTVFNVEEVMKGPPLQDDVRIIDYVKQHILQPPTPSDVPYNLESKPGTDTSMGQGQFIRKYLKEMRNGFFVECGALDGETRSNTLYMERELGWQGLLIEGDPKNAELMRQKQRRAWTAGVCLATRSYPEIMLYNQHFNLGKISDKSMDNTLGGTGGKASGNVAEVQCVPFFTLLTALDIKTVDYFSLDVEGHELDVLRTIPFDRINIRTLSVEYIHGKEGKDTLREFMESKGYKVIGTVTNPQGLANDFLFAKNGE